MENLEAEQRKVPNKGEKKQDALQEKCGKTKKNQKESQSNRVKQSRLDSSLKLINSFTPQGTSMSICCTSSRNKKTNILNYFHIDLIKTKGVAEHRSLTHTNKPRLTPLVKPSKIQAASRNILNTPILHNNTSAF